MIGTGSMARRHSAVLATHPEAQLAVVCSTERSVPVSRTFQEEFGFESTTTSFDQIVQNRGLDLVYICSPDRTHPDLVCQALEAGKHVFCEKPLARTEEEFQSVRKALEQNPDRVLQVGMNCRFREQYSLPHQLIHSGKLGAVRLVRGTYLLNKVASAKRREKSWWLDFPPEIQFFLHANGVHILDLMRWYGGPVSSAFCRASGFELGEDYKADTFSISLQFKSGALGEVLISSAAFLPRDISLQTWCDKGSVVGTKVFCRSGEELAPESEEIRVVQETIDLAMQYDALVRAIKGRGNPMNSFEEAYENFLLIRALEESLALDQVVPLSRVRALTGTSPSR
jgi:myo-inositol 2-dehydrogenase/D-chiro-inositol 1-dehydrogenase